MATSYGWTGKILRVDLTTGKITETPTSDYAPQLIGGRGIAAMIYWELVSPECEALSPENALIMMTGVASGTLSPSSGKFTITCKSPVPVKECYSWGVPGGHWSADLKFAGYDGIVLTGKSPKPVYLWINDGKAELRDAGRLWGMKLSEMMLELYSQHGPQTRIAGIGPAGENLVRSAPIIVDREHATGSSGAGAVMGSKNLKVIAVLGTGAVNVAKPKELTDLWYYYRRLLNRTPAEVKAGDSWPMQEKSLSYYMYHGPHIPYAPGHPAKPTDPKVYFENNGLDDPISLFREAVDKGTVKLKWGGCYACPVCCALTYQSTDINIPSGAGQCNDMEGYCRHEWAGYKKVVGIPNIWFDRWSDDLGLSITNSLGYHLDWFFDLVKLGIITSKNTGLDLDKWDNPNAGEFPYGKPWTLEFIRGALEGVAYRKTEIFSQMAEGQERFLKSISEKYPEAISVYQHHVYRPGHYVHWTTDGRATGTSAAVPPFSALYQITSTRTEINKTSPTGGKSFDSGAAGLTSAQVAAIYHKGNLKYFGAANAADVTGDPQTWENKVGMTITCQNLSVLMDCITYCGWAGAYSLYSTYTPPDYLGDWAIGAKVYSAVTGIQTTHEQMLEAMNTVFALEHSIQIREGRTREEDKCTDWEYKQKDWAWTTKAEFEGKVMDEYYTRRGWDLKTSVPRRSTLEKLGLKKIADELESKYKVSVPA